MYSTFKKIKLQETIICISETLIKKVNEALASNNWFFGHPL